MRAVSLLPLFLLAACAAPSYAPYVGDVAAEGGKEALAGDEAACLPQAQAYTDPLSVSSIASAGVQGVAKNAAGAAVSPLVPLAGGVGAAGSELLSEVGLLGDARRKVFLRCLEHRGERSRMYSVMDPGF